MGLDQRDVKRRMPTRLLAMLVWVIAVGLARVGDASACGAFAGLPSEKSLAASLPFLTVEQVLVLWDKETGVEDFIRETRFDKAGKPFGFVVPTPSKPEVSSAKPPFDALRAAYGFEDPNRLKIGGGGGPVQGGGSGGAEPAVVVLSQQRIGSFVAFTLSARDPGAFDGWLRENGFAMTEAAKPWIQHYVALGFFFVALRYDAPREADAGAGAGSMTSETVRIRFQTPNPYYPYLEPAHEAAAPAPTRRMLTGWLVTREPMGPVAFHPTEQRARAWQRPWREGARYEASSAALSKQLGDELGKLLPSSERLYIQTFRDLKVSREGYGDVFFVREHAESKEERDAALEARRRLLGAVDPTLLSADVGEADAATPASATSVERRGSAKGCGVTPAGARGVSVVGALLLIVSLGLARRRRYALSVAPIVVASALAGCRSRDTTSSADAAADADAATTATATEARPATRAERENQALAILAGADEPSIARADWEPGVRAVGLSGISSDALRPRRGEVDIGAIQQGAVTVADGDRVSAMLRPHLRHCYEAALDADAKVEGTVTLSVDVTQDGTVSAAVPVAQRGVSPGLVSCCAGAFRRVTFAAPTAPANLRVPLTFRRTKP